MKDIRSWLTAHGLEKYAEIFAAQAIGVDLLSELTDADLKELGVAALGDRKRLLKATAAHCAPAGERRHASVMFSDLVGYTALNEVFDPEEVEAVMARIKHEAITVIERHGGRINQFVGDEVMAMFGVPVARRDDARRAVRAALELHQAVDAIAAGLTQKLGRVLALHSGIQTGLVVARRGDSRAGDYTLTGDTVNTAARLRSLAKPGELVVSPQMWQQVCDFFEGEAGAPIEVRGKDQPLVPWRIVKERAVHGAGSRPMVGRAEETKEFISLTQACTEHQRGRVVFVRGEPGIGKSRLCAEFMDIARVHGLVCHASSILDFGARTGHDAMRRIAQGVLGLPSDADESNRADAIGIFASAGAASHAPFLYDLLDVAVPASVRALLSAIDVAVRQKSSLDALCELTRLGMAGAPMLLLVEDIHWADTWTLRQLGALAALASHEPLLLVMSTRFAGDPSTGDWRSALQGLPVSNIDLAPLELDDALRLAAGASSLFEGLLRSCAERAAGNPLFLEHLLLNAGEEGANELPGSIQALVQARMDWLSPHDKNALQAAAVWGPRVPIAALRHLLDDPAFEARALIDHFLLRPVGDDLDFTHALIREGAYGSLLHARRRELHLAAARWIEARDVALAAEHYERAQDERAAQAYLHASEALIGDFKYSEALILVERALPLANDQSVQFKLRVARAKLLLANARPADSIQEGRTALEVAQTGMERSLALTEIASGMRMLDRHAEGLALLDEAQPLAEQAAVELELSRLHHLRGNLLYSLSRAAECQRSHELALVFARQAGSVEAQANAMGGIGDALYAQGRMRAAHEAFTRCVALARQHGLLRVEVSYLTMLGWTSLFQMDIAGSLAAAASGIEIAQRVSHWRSEMIARTQHALADGWYRGDLQAALPHMDRALELGRLMGNRGFMAVQGGFSALLALRQGDLAKARSQATGTLEIAGPIGLNFIGAVLFGVLGRAEPDLSSRRKAMAAGEEILSHGALSHNFLIFYDLAIEASLKDGQWDEAERYCALFDAYAAAEPFTWSEFVSKCGRALIRVGRGETGAELLTQLQILRRQAHDTQCFVYLERLDAAIVRAGR